MSENKINPKSCALCKYFSSYEPDIPIYQCINGMELMYDLDPCGDYEEDE